MTLRFLPAEFGGKGFPTSWQLFGGQRQTQVILACVKEVGQALYKPHGDENIGKRTDAHAWIAFFEPCDGTGRCAGAGCEISHSYSTPQTCVANVVPKPFER